MSRSILRSSASAIWDDSEGAAPPRRRLPAAVPFLGGRLLRPAIFVMGILAAGLFPPPAAAEPSGLILSGSLLTDASVLQTLSPAGGAGAILPAPGTTGVTAGAAGSTAAFGNSPALGSQAGLAPGGFSQFTLNFVNTNRQFAKVAGSAMLTLSYGGYADLYQAAVSEIAGPAEPTLFSLLSSNGAAVTADLRQLYLEIYTPAVDLSAGREIVNFGVGTFFSPIDAFTEPTLSDLNFIRSGSDVVRVDAGFGELSGLEAVSTVTDSVDTLTSALKLYTNIAGFDLAGVFMYRGLRNELLAGADFKGDLLLGVYGEGVEHFSLISSARWFEGMAGADYSFGDWLYLTLEGYYNGNPAAPGSLSPSQIAGAGGLFLNEYYAFFNTRWVLNDLMSLQASLIYDFSANSLLPTVQYIYNIVQNANLILYGRYFGGNILSGGSWPGPDLQYGVEAQASF